MGKFRALETDLERMKEKIEVENEAKAEIQKAMSKALAEAQIWKSKYTTEACARIEDLENAKAKLLVCKLQKLLFLSKKNIKGKTFFEPIFLLLLFILFEFSYCSKLAFFASLDIYRRVYCTSGYPALPISKLHPLLTL